MYECLQVSNSFCLYLLACDHQEHTWAKQAGSVTAGTVWHLRKPWGPSKRALERASVGFGLVVGGSEFTEVGFPARLDAVRQWE